MLENLVQSLGNEDYCNLFGNEEKELAGWFVAYLDGARECELSPQEKTAFNILKEWGVMDVDHEGLIYIATIDL